MVEQRKMLHFSNQQESRNTDVFEADHLKGVDINSTPIGCVKKRFNINDTGLFKYQL